MIRAAAGVGRTLSGTAHRGAHHRLLRAGLDEIEAAMPYERGPKVISRDDQGDPVYEDVGLTPALRRSDPQFKKRTAPGQA